MKRVLFVDDEGRILQGLRRMLRALRHEIDLGFAESGREALERFDESPFDVLVTDMRMPGMNGAELLNAILTRYPSTVRIVLSGQCDKDTVLQCVGPAHQFLTKPCCSDTLKSVVIRACGIGEYRINQTWKQRLSRLSSLPSLPANYERLVAEVDSPRPSIDRIAEVISTDVGMGSKLLQLVGSGFFGTPRQIPHLRSAVQLLGLDVIRALVQSTRAFVPVDVIDSSRYEAMTEHSLRVAAAAKAVAESSTEDDAIVNCAFLAGFLHKVSAMALLEPIGTENPSANDDACDAFPIGPHSCADASAYLLSLWGFPDSIVGAIGLHEMPEYSSDKSFSPLTAVHVADAVLSEEGVDRVDIGYLRRIGCGGRLDHWNEICQEFMLAKVS